MTYPKSLVAGLGEEPRQSDNRKCVIFGLYCCGVSIHVTLMSAFADQFGKDEGLLLHFGKIVSVNIKPITKAQSDALDKAVDGTGLRWMRGSPTFMEVSRSMLVRGSCFCLRPCASCCHLLALGASVPGRFLGFFTLLLVFLALLF